MRVEGETKGKIGKDGSTVTYVYQPLGSWVPNIPGQPTSPIKYPNDPQDPTKPENNKPKEDQNKDPKQDKKETPENPGQNNAPVQPKANAQVKRLANTGTTETNTGLAGLGLATFAGMLAASRRRKEK